MELSEYMVQTRLLLAITCCGMRASVLFVRGSGIQGRAKRENAE